MLYLFLRDNVSQTSTKEWIIKAWKEDENAVRWKGREASYPDVSFDTWSSWQGREDDRVDNGIHTECSTLCYVMSVHRQLVLQGTCRSPGNRFKPSQLPSVVREENKWRVVVWQLCQVALVSYVRLVSCRLPTGDCRLAMVGCCRLSGRGARLWWTSTTCNERLVLTRLGLQTDRHEYAWTEVR